ncbi:MAG: YdbL family protein [Sphingomicrobium sp.]
MTNRVPVLAAALAAGLFALAGAGAQAQTPAVDAARRAGIIGERYDGYLGIAGPVSPSVRSQTATINIRRRSLYNNLAANKGVAPQEVGITAGCQLLARVQVGEAYLLADGAWRRRLAGQRVAVPDYCR